MGDFGSEEDLARFLMNFGPQYRKYAPALWNDGAGVRSTKDLVHADVQDLEQLGVWTIHARCIIAGKAL